MDDEDLYLSCDDESPAHFYDCDDDSDDGYVEENGNDDYDFVEEQDEVIENPQYCKVITKESLMAAQKEDLERVMDLLLVKEHHARTLLIHFCWDAYKIVETLSERGKEWLFVKAGVPMAIHFGLNTQFLCNLTGWRGHFIVKINEGQSRRITCMAHKCMAICDEGSIRSIVSAQYPCLAEKFDRFLLESYIEDNKLVQWCPSVPHCGNAIRVENDKYCEVECACGLQFCFNCLSDAHSPCSCLMWKLWMKKSRDEFKTVNWMMTNAMYCLNCHKPVVKNGGCNIITCICGKNFCWLCGGAKWNTLEGHYCGRYKKDHEKKVEEARRQLWRYTHYYGRFKAHIDSLKAETKLKEMVQEKIVKLTFAYFMFGDELFEKTTQEEREIKQNLFEDHQQQLEANVEKLSKHLEDDFSEYSIHDLYKKQTQIIVLSELIDKFCRSMYEFIDNDLLGLHLGIHIIASYRSKGAEKASTLPEEQAR